MFVARIWKEMTPGDNKLQENFGYYGAKTLLLEDAQDMTYDTKLMAKVISHFYTGKDGLTRENKQSIMDMYTDAYFTAPNTETIKLHAEASVPVYNYLYSYKGSNSLSPLYAMGDPEASKEDFGVAHGDDLYSMFRLLPLSNYTKTDKQFVRLYQRMVLNFAKYGNPTPLATEEIPMWPPAQKSAAACVYMNLDLNFEEMHRMFAERMTFWNLIKFKDQLEKYEIDEEEKDLLREIDTTITEEEEEEGDEVIVGKAKVGKPWKKKAWKKAKKARKAKKKGGKGALRRRRLAKRLKKLKCP